MRGPHRAGGRGTRSRVWADGIDVGPARRAALHAARVLRAAAQARSIVAMELPTVVSRPDGAAWQGLHLRELAVDDQRQLRPRRVVYRLRGNRGGNLRGCDET